MNHATEEQLILHYYGEEGDPSAPLDSLATEHHLEECSECRELYASLVRVLNVVDSLPVPERTEDYGAQVWRRIERRIPARSRWAWLMPTPVRWAAAATAFAGLMVIAFFAGRSYPGAVKHPAPTAVQADAQVRERILLVAVGDYLERSQMVLVELANTSAKGPVDISSEQQRAGDLVDETRLYRQTAQHTGDSRITSVLDELEPLLLDIAHAPSRMSPAELQSLRQRLEAEGILFKIRVLGSNVRNQDVPAAQTTGQTL
jgi:hypothetical protein